MSTKTSNLGLTKPSLSDAADITAYNGNWDILDTQVSNIKDKVDNLSTNVEDLNGTLPISKGGTGATTASQARTNLGAAPSNHTHNYAGSSTAGGVANSAMKLETARTIRTNLGSTSTASFNGTENVTPGVTGTLPIANGGTGATTASDALSKLGAAPSTHTHNYAGSSSVGGAATFAEKLVTGRTIRTDLGKTSTATFNGTEDITPGVTGTLPIGNGGTGVTSIAEVQAKFDIVPMNEIPGLNVWKKYTNNPLGYALNASANATIGVGTGSTISIYYCEEVKNVDGKIYLAEETKLTKSTVTDFEVIKGKFATGLSGGLSLIYYIPQNSTITISNGQIVVNSAQQVNAVSSEYLGYVVSKTNNTYPTSGKHTDGYWYEYCGQLGEKPYTYGTADLTPGESTLETGKLYFVYE